MAGSGALSYALQQCGVDVTATDDESWKVTKEFWKPNPWYAVEKMECVEAVERYMPDCSLLICSWPPMDETAYRALEAMRRMNSDAQMLYIGEQKGGATANDAFFETVVPVEDNDFEKAVTNYKQFFGIHDFPYLVK